MADPVPILYKHRFVQRIAFPIVIDALCCALVTTGLQLGEFLVQEVSSRQRYDYEAHKGHNNQHDDGVEHTPDDERTHNSSSSLRWQQRKNETDFLTSIISQKGKPTLSGKQLPFLTYEGT